jgi:hypothetical protein
MADDAAPDLSQPDTTTPDAGTPADKAGMIRDLNAERERRRQAEERAAALEAAQAERDRVEAEKRGEYQRLYEDVSGKLKTYEERLAAADAELTGYRSAADQQRQRRVEALPEALRDLVPPGLTGADLDGWLDRAEAKAPALAQPKREPDTLARTGHGGGGDPEQLTQAELRHAEQHSGWWRDGKVGGELIVAPAIVKKHFKARNPG